MSRRSSKAESLCRRAAEFEGEARRVWLERECAGDRQLRSRVDALLQEQDAGTSLGVPTLAGGLISTPLTEGPGSRIGRYKLLQRIGEGGFGVVYMAEQRDPVVRQVALKIIKLGMDTQQVVARFEAERQALAMMEHPNIAKVLDGGATDTGRPYFAMELIRGVPITTYCDRNKLGTAERLRLFAQVCRAVQHAHQKGIIHRDLKPSNVMVTLHDGVPVPKVIDFGIAKATNQRLTERTLFTEYQQFIGTPAYMSPEQAEMSGLDVDTRTDIYSLGVMLYEMITGTPPFDNETLFSAGYAEVQRIICEVDPPRPSMRISTLGDRLERIARDRNLDAASLGRLVRGDLDWIVMRAMEKDRTRRYESAGAFAEDIERHLDDHPVEAGPPGRVYRARKFLRRNRRAVGAAALIAGALVLGLVGTTWGMLAALDAKRDAERQSSDAQRSRGIAVEEAGRAQAVTGFLIDVLALADHSVALTPEVSVRAMLDDAAARAGTDLAGQPAVEATVRSTIGRAYRSIGEFELAERNLRRAAALHRELDDVPPLEAYTVLWSLTHVSFELERHDSFEVVQLAQEQRNRAISVTSPELAALLVRFLEAVDRADIEGAARLLEQSRSLAEEVLSAGDPLWTLYADSFMEAGYAVWYSPIETASEAYFGEALEIQRRELPGNHPQIGTTLSLLVGVLNRQREYERGEATIREALEVLEASAAEDQIQVAFAESLLGETLVGQGRYAEAEGPLLSGYRKIARSNGRTNFATIDGLGRLIDLYEVWGRVEEARRYRTELAVILASTGYVMPWQLVRKSFGPEEQALVEALDLLPLPTGGYAGNDLSKNMSPGTWTAGVERSLTERRRLLADEDPRAVAIARLMVLGWQTWKAPPPEPTMRSMVAEVILVLEPWADRQPLDLAVALAQAARFASVDGDRTRADELAARCVQLIAGISRPDSWVEAGAKTHVAEALTERGDFADAEALLLAALPVFERQFGAESRWADRCRSNLVELYSRWQRPKHGLPHAEQALGFARGQAEKQDATAEDRSRYHRWRETVEMLRSGAHP